MPYIQASAVIKFTDNQIVVQDQTNYANAALYVSDIVTWSSNNILRFDSFTAYIVRFPSGEIKYYATKAAAAFLKLECEVIPSPAQLGLGFSIDGGEIGIYTVGFVTIPTGIVLNADNIYNVGDVVYYNESLYTCIAGSGVQFDPSVASHWSSVVDIQGYIDGMLNGVQPNNNYLSLVSDFSLDYITADFTKTLKSLACEILREPTMKDICKRKLFEKYNMLKSIIPQLEGVIDTNIDSLELRNMLNYVNQYCTR